MWRGRAKGRWECRGDGERREVKKQGGTHVASITTATPSGRIASSTAMAICFVNRSWTCSRRENVSAMRASLESPRTDLFGM